MPWKLIDERSVWICGYCGISMHDDGLDVAYHDSEFMCNLAKQNMLLQHQEKTFINTLTPSNNSTRLIINDQQSFVY